MFCILFILILDKKSKNEKKKSRKNLIWKFVLLFGKKYKLEWKKWRVAKNLLLFLFQYSIFVRSQYYPFFPTPLSMISCLLFAVHMRKK